MADIYLSYGMTRKADDTAAKIYSVTYQKADWRVDLTHFTQYNRSPWYGEHPEWGTITIPSHNVASVTKELLSKNVSKVKLFLDFGVAYANHLSWLNSSHWMFRENIGLQCEKWRFFLRHTSNAGLKGRNGGEDGIIVEYQFY